MGEKIKIYMLEKFKEKLERVRAFLWAQFRLLGGLLWKILPARFRRDLPSASASASTSATSVSSSSELSLKKKVLTVCDWGLRELTKLGPPLRKLNKNIFSVRYRGKIHAFYMLFLGATIAYFVGKIVAMILTTPLEQPPPFGGMLVSVTSDEEVIQGTEAVRMGNLFHAKLVNDDGQKAKLLEDDNVVCTAADVPSGLTLKVLGTIVLQNPIKSLAAVQVDNNEVRSLREGDKISGIATIGKIERLKIILKNLQTGQCEYVSSQDMSWGKSKDFTVLSPEEGQKLLKAKVDGISNEGDKFFLSKKLVNEKLRDIESVLSQAKAIQVPNPDGTLSFKITEIAPGSIYSYLGIEENDKIVKINGKKISGLNEVMNLFANLQSIDKLQLTLSKEDGNERTLDYSLTK
ncbi:MAG: PDZ domain-containing protein [Oligoflexia bacterium]|nr:PDZ domain-containing protein [Oligoflexia bacterium]